MNLTKNVIKYIEDEEDLDLTQLEYIIGCLRNSEPIFTNLELKPNCTVELYNEILAKYFDGLVNENKINGKVLQLIIEAIDMQTNRYMFTYGLLPNLFSVDYDINIRMYEIVKRDLIEFLDSNKESYLSILNERIEDDD